jgi:hypothetical protein
MTGPNHCVGAVEAAIAEFKEPLGVNAERFPLVISLEGNGPTKFFQRRSDKRASFPAFENKQLNCFVRTRAPVNQPRPQDSGLFPALATPSARAPP